jgi:hypothetical protein
VIENTARSNAASVDGDVDCTPLTLRTYWRAAASISVGVAFGSSPRSVVMFRHMPCSVERLPAGAAVALLGCAAMRCPATARGRRPGTAFLATLAVGTLALVACTSNIHSTSTSTASSAPVAATAVAITDAPTSTQSANAATPVVHQAVLDYWAASRACGQRPKLCKPQTFTASEGTLRQDVETYVATLISKNEHLATVDTVRPGGTAVSTDESYVVVDSVTVDLSTGTTATTVECVFDPTPLLGPPGADGQPQVVTSDAVARRFVHTFYLEGSRWLAGAEQADTSGACADTPDTVAVDYTTPGS